MSRNSKNNNNNDTSKYNNENNININDTNETRIRKSSQDLKSKNLDILGKGFSDKAIFYDVPLSRPRPVPSPRKVRPKIGGSATVTGTPSTVKAAKSTAPDANFPFHVVSPYKTRLMEDKDPRLSADKDPRLLAENDGPKSKITKKISVDIGTQSPKRFETRYGDHLIVIENVDNRPEYRRAVVVDPENLPDVHSHGRTTFGGISRILTKFCERTSSHGIPHIGSTRSRAGKLFWLFIFLFCTAAFFLHTYYSVSLYLDFSTIMQMKRIFHLDHRPAVADLQGDPSNTSKRRKRKVAYEPWLARCRCTDPHNKECVPLINDWQATFSTCLCYFDVNSGNIWPCYDVSLWTEHRCAKCSVTNACPYPPKGADPSKGETDEPCVCQGISNFCIRRPEGPFKQWKGPEYGSYYVTTTTEPPPPSTEPPTSEPRPIMNSDTSSIERQELLTYIVAKMEPADRRALSYGMDEFIILCSFDGMSCEKLRDFQLHDTPKHGNCYTYNFNTTFKLTNSRAGPLYGLRLLINVNQTDYLEFIEGAGVKVVVHNQKQYPFPDTFGYSAPTGAISSFGLKKKNHKRLGHPWSTCVNDEKILGQWYIFDEEYSTEGCFRSCLQTSLIRNCGCANPRFPIPPNTTICTQDNETQIMCQNKEEERVEKLSDKECSCFQPCTEVAYQTTYSAASWPSENFNNSECFIINRNNLSCHEYFRRHTAFVEVFYEQLNSEVLTEQEAYTIFSLLADFGGNIGLWIGFSTITMVEFIQVFLEIIFYLANVGTKPIIRQTRSFIRASSSNRLFTIPSKHKLVTAAEEDEKSLGKMSSKTNNNNEEHRTKRGGYRGANEPIKFDMQYSDSDAEMDGRM